MNELSSLTNLTRLNNPQYYILFFILIWVVLYSCKSKFHSNMAKQTVVFLLVFMIVDLFIQYILSFVNTARIGSMFGAANPYRANLLPIANLKLVLFIFAFFVFWVSVRYFQKYKFQEKSIKIFTILTSFMCICFMLSFLVGNIYFYIFLYVAFFTAPRAAGGWSVFLAYDGGGEWFKTWLLHFCLSSLLFIGILKLFI